MPAPYSLDLRNKVLEAYVRGEPKSQICRTFNISRNTLDLWIRRQQETGTVAPNTNYRRGPAPKISDLEAFEEFALKNGDLTQKKMAGKWPEKVSAV